jgi:hypothetical protein
MALAHTLCIRVLLIRLICFFSLARREALAKSSWPLFSLFRCVEFSGTVQNFLDGSSFPPL